jgi:HEPN domain-containing protein
MERSADWIAQAEGDLAHAELSAEHRHYDWACFSAQQASDKAVKAVLYRAGAEPWGHSVPDLLQAVRSIASVDDELIEAAKEVDKAYISARYPDTLPAGAPRDRYTRSEADRMVSHARGIIRFCQGLLAQL